jgi:YHS domain-containing protein
MARPKLLVTAMLVLGLSLAGPALALDPVYSNWRGLALSGYDPVAYFTDGKPVPGSASFTLEWMGATWRFASAEHRDAFTANPLLYAPQYGGYCAWAVSQDRTASSDPEAWRIVDGKLYLNYSRDVQKQWETDVPGNIRKADTNWPGLRGAP